MNGVERVVGNMCMFDMKQWGHAGLNLVKKPTGSMTNSFHIARRLQVKCNNMHRHITLINGRANAAEVYPDKMRREIIMGLIEQMEKDERIDKGNVGTTAAFDKDNSEAVEFWDDLSGKRLDPKLVRRERKKWWSLETWGICEGSCEQVLGRNG